jgi:hypothetical protein
MSRHLAMMQLRENEERNDISLEQMDRLFTLYRTKAWEMNDSDLLEAIDTGKENVKWHFTHDARHTLGFIQGILYKTGAYTWEELRAHNRSF